MREGVRLAVDIGLFARWGFGRCCNVDWGDGLFGTTPPSQMRKHRDRSLKTRKQGDSATKEVMV